MLVVNTTLPAKTVTDLIALARARPGELNYASTGTGASNHLAAELFKSLASLDIVRVNYKGGGIALNALMGGEVQMMFTTVVTGTPHVRAGKLRALAVTSSKPSALAPDLPTVAASGLTDFESTTATGIFLPQKTPPAILGRLHDELTRFLASAEVRQKFFSSGMEIVAGTPRELGEVIKTDVMRFGKLAKQIGIPRN